MQTDNPVLDGFAKLLTNAAGAAQSLRAEVESVVKARIERFAAELDFVPREEFEAVKAMASKARIENERLAARIQSLEAKIESGQRHSSANRSPRPRARDKRVRTKPRKL